jgi:hypothetical protein
MNALAQWACRFSLSMGLPYLNAPGRNLTSANFFKGLSRAVTFQSQSNPQSKEGLTLWKSSASCTPYSWRQLSGKECRQGGAQEKRRNTVDVLTNCSNVLQNSYCPHLYGRSRHHAHNCWGVLTNSNMEQIGNHPCA